jgi:hypothetical protein
LEIQAQEEDFDLALLTELEEHVVPRLGTPRVPDALVAELARILHRGSEVYELEDAPLSSTSFASLSNNKSVDMVHISDLGSTEPGQLVPRERFSYWCFDLLFLICSRISEG